MPEVSVVIPSHLGGPYLREAVNSVSQQAPFDSGGDPWEVIVVSDGCVEDMSDLERDPRVHVVRQPRRGLPIARNVGVAHAQSPLIAFLDADDLMAPNRLATQVLVMQKDQNVALCHSRCRRIDQHGAFIKDGPLRDFQYAELLRGEGTPLMSSIMVRRSVFNEVGGFNPLLAAAEDMDFILKVAREGSLHFLPEMLVDYRKHDHNTYSASGTTDSVGTLKVILAQHRMAAEARGDDLIVKATRQGARHILPPRSQFDLEGAGEALTERQFGRFITLMGRALLRSPVASTWVTSQRIRRGRPRSRAPR
jgi:glycosyltransferase involved in cell wall biosynthesis